MGKRLATDSAQLTNDNTALLDRVDELSKQLRTSEKGLTDATNRAVDLDARKEMLEKRLADATDGVERLNKALVRARGTDTEANQASFAQLRPDQVPQPVWLIKKTVFDGSLEFKNVGGGKASSVSVDTNYPEDVTLVGAYFDAADQGFSSRFTIEPASMREKSDLVYKVAFTDEAGNRETITKKAAERQ